MPTDLGLPDAVAAFEKAYLEGVLASEQGHIGRTARASGITERTLHRKMKRYDLNKSVFARKTESSV